MVGLKENASSIDCMKYIQQKTDETTEKLKQILAKRVINFGIENAVIQCVGGEGRILLQLPGVKPDIRLHKLLNASANLEFWETYDNKEIFPLLDQMNKELKNILTETDAPYLSPYKGERNEENIIQESSVCCFNDELSHLSQHTNHFCCI